MFISYSVKRKRKKRGNKGNAKRSEMEQNKEGRKKHGKAAKYKKKKQIVQTRCTNRVQTKFWFPKEHSSFRPTISEIWK